MTDDEESGPQEGREEDPELPRILRGADLDVDEDAIAEAAETSPVMEGFQTGSGVEVEGPPDEVDRDVEIETMEIRSKAFNELDFQQAEKSGSEELGGEDLVVDRDFGRMDGGDDGSLLLPTPTPPKAKPTARHRGLEEMERRRKRRSGARRLVTATATVLILGGGGFAMAYFGVVDIPRITLMQRSRSAAPGPVVLPGPEPRTPVMSHVVLVDTWREIQTPLAMADALRARMPNLLGFVTALLIDGDRHFALMVGPAYSVAEANNLKVPLAVAFDLLNPDPENWAVREAPYSFFLGEYETLGEANGRVRELADLSVPAFVLRVTYSPRATGLRVYGGAFSDEFQGGEMGRLLSENDLGDSPLTERRGRLP